MFYFSKCNKAQGPNKGSEPLPRQKYRHKSHVYHVVSSEPCQKNESHSVEDLYTLSGTANSTTPRVNVKINDITISMIIITGASTDIMDDKAFAKVNHMNNLDLQPTTKCIFGYSANYQLSVLGQFVTNIEADLKYVKSVIHVIQGNHGSLVSYATTFNLGLVYIRRKHINDCPQVCDMLVKKYPTLFEGIAN